VNRTASYKAETSLQRKNAKCQNPKAKSNPNDKGPIEGGGDLEI